MVPQSEALENVGHHGVARVWRVLALVCIASVLALSQISDRSVSASTEEASQPTVAGSEQSIPEESTERPAITPDQLAEFCLENRDEGERETAMGMLQSLFEGLSGKHLTHRSTENLLLNGGFEEWDDGPCCWHYYADGNAEVVSDSTVLKGGKGCLKVELRDGPAQIKIEQTVVVALSCAGYRLKGWTRRSGAVTFEIRVCSGEPSGDWTELLKTAFEPSNDEKSVAGEWIEKSIELPRPILLKMKDDRPFQRVKVSALVSGQGILWLDDMSLTAISEREALELREREVLELPRGLVADTGGPMRYWFPRGRVCDVVSKEPIEGAEISGDQVLAYDVDEGRVLTRAGRPEDTTNRSGFFEFQEPVTLRKLRVRAEGYEENYVIFEDGEETDLMLFLKPTERKYPVEITGSVYGTIYLDGSAYIGAGEVFMEREGKGEDSFWIKLKDGDYRIDELREGSYLMRIETIDGYQAKTSFTLTAEEVKKVDLTLDAEGSKKPRFWIAGYVRDARTGDPVSGAVVAADFGGKILTRTNSRGFFMIMDQLEIGMRGCQVMGYKSGYKASAVSLKPDTPTGEDGRVIVELELEPGKETFAGDWEEAIKKRGNDETGEAQP